MKKIITLIILSLTTYSTYSAWDAKALAHFEKYTYPYRDTYVSSVIGLCDPTVVYKKKKFGKEKLISLEIDNYLIKKTSVNFLLNNKDSSKKPLMVFIPGAFNNYNSLQSIEAFRDYSSMGYHVLVLNNPWSKNIMKAKPMHVPGDIENEGHMSYEILKQFMNQYFSKNHNDAFNGIVHLSGVSYGAYVAAMMSAIDTDTQFPIINGNTTIFSPPHSLDKTLTNLDQILISSNTQMNPLSYAYDIGEICLQHFKNNTTKIEELSGEAEKLVGYMGFKWLLAGSLLEYDKQWNSYRYPKNILYRNYLKWFNNLSFTDHLKKFHPNILSFLSSEKGNIEYWINKANDNGKNVRVFVSDDDFLNDPHSWSFNSSILVVPNGGHYGFRATKWFEEFQSIIFKLKE